MKQQKQVTYLGTALDKLISGEPLALKIINIVNRKLKLPYGKVNF